MYNHNYRVKRLTPAEEGEIFDRISRTKGEASWDNGIFTYDLERPLEAGVQYDAVLGATNQNEGDIKIQWSFRTAAQGSREAELRNYNGTKVKMHPYDGAIVGLHPRITVVLGEGLGVKTDSDGEYDFRLLDGESVKKLVEHNMGLVLKTTQTYFKTEDYTDFEDFVQEGMRGLIKAAEKFDPGRSKRFSTYAVQWIRQVLQRAVHNNHIINLSFYVQERRNQLEKCRSKLEMPCGREPSDKDISKYFDFTEEEAAYLSQLQCECASLDAPIDNGKGDEKGGGTLLDLIPDSKTESPFDYVASSELSRNIEALLEGLDERARSIVKMYYGVGCGAMTLEEISSVYGIHRERVRQIKLKAMRKMKKWASLRREDFDGIY